MREPPNWFLRILVPLALVLAGVGMLFAVLRNTQTAGQGSAGTLTSGATPAAATPPATAATPPSETPPSTSPPTTTATAEQAAPEQPVEGSKPAEAAAPPAAATTPTAGATYSVRKHAAAAGGFAPLGSTVTRKDGGTYEIELKFAAFGAGLESLSLSNHTEKILDPAREVLQEFAPRLGDPDKRWGLAAFGALAIDVNGQTVLLGVPARDAASVYWKELAPGSFEATIVEQPAGGAEREVVRITRTYVLGPKEYEFSVRQKVENLTDQPVRFAWHQIGPLDQPAETVRYGGDPRNVRFGYMMPPSRDPAQIVQAGDGAASLLHRADALGSPDERGVYPPRRLWPNRSAEKDGLILSWAATTSRYFTVAVQPSVPDAATQPGPLTPSQKTLPVASVERVAIPIDRPANVAPGVSGPFAAIGMELIWPVKTLGPVGQADASADVSVTAYAGPTSRKIIDAQPVSSRMGLGSVLVYTFGGPCAFCTFQSITYLLRWFLGLLHDNVLFDWSLAIIVLVVCVRTLLHPVTRWSQINMLRFSKSLAKLAPKQKAIQEKYGNDPTKMRQEVARLMQEEGVSVGAGAMGCLPAFLQMPIWLALAPMLYFTFELRHQGAFFGLFQQLSGGSWSFFADLAEPDHFLRFGREFHIPLISSLMGPIDGLNVMPLLMGVVFYIQQKYMQPPSATPMTPEQEQQMKIMKIMTVVLFPLMMYNAPSGLALYFFTNSTLAIIESKHIRSRAERLGLDQPQPKRKAADGKPGFLGRMAQLAEERQKMMEEARKLQAKKDKKR